MKPLTPEQRKLIADYLLSQFPWLSADASEPDISGADIIAQLSDIYDTLGGR